MIEKNFPRDVAFLPKTCVIIPTYNASSYWAGIHSALERQGVGKHQVLIIDSSSTDDTADLVRAAGYGLKVIPTESFRHGATRQMAAEMASWAEYLVYMTQDALPCEDDSIAKLLRAFTDPDVGGVYGRQIPREFADPIERHSRLFNYPGVSHVRTTASRAKMGIKAAFFSNSFAAYRRAALNAVGGFPLDVIICEDSVAAARMLLSDWKIVYQADATVIHSHPLTVRQEFSRYFDIGVYHAREHKLLEAFGTPQGEGLRFVKSEMRFLRENGRSFIPLAMIRTLSKFVAYQLGLHEASLPVGLLEMISAHPRFWQDRRMDELARLAEVEVTVQTAHAPRH
jgi:rhamnosyltransferase